MALLPAAKMLATDVALSVLSASGPGVPEARAYTPFGFLAAGAPGLGFAGQLPEGGTGNYLLGHGYRAYSPVLARFLSADRFSPFARGGINGYAYCQGDPVNATDPAGRWRVPLGVALMVVAAPVGGYGFAALIKPDPESDSAGASYLGLGMLIGSVVAAGIGFGLLNKGMARRRRSVSPGSGPASSRGSRSSPPPYQYAVDGPFPRLDQSVGSTPGQAGSVIDSGLPTYAQATALNPQPAGSVNRRSVESIPLQPLGTDSSVYDRNARLREWFARNDRQGVR